MGASKIIDAFVAYQFIKILSTPWNLTDAYKLGIIDDKGKLLKKTRDLRGAKEKKAYTMIHRLIWNIKRLLDKLPPTKTRIGSFSTALWMLKEHSDLAYGADFDVAYNAFENYLVEHHDYNLTELLTEKVYAGNLAAGKYRILDSIDDPGGTQEGDTFTVKRNLNPETTFAGSNIFMVTNDRTREEMMVTDDDIELVEKFHDYVKHFSARKILTGVYIDPNMGDFRDILRDAETKGINEIRFFGNHEVMYAWDGYAHIHDEMIDSLKLNKYNYTYFGMFEANPNGSVKKVIGVSTHTYVDERNIQAILSFQGYLKKMGNDGLFEGLM